MIQGGETYRRDAGGGVRVEIPDTGISLDELQRYLRDWLGRETHATGEVVRAAKGWSLTVRYGDEPGRHARRRRSRRAIGEGAERLMAQALPYRYAEYLSRHGRFAEALALLPSIAPRGSAVERGRAYSDLGNGIFYQGDMARAAQKAQQGLDADPDNPTLYGYLAAGASNLGHDETGLERRRRRPLSHARRGGGQPRSCRSRPSCPSSSARIAPNWRATTMRRSPDGRDCPGWTRALTIKDRKAATPQRSTSWLWRAGSPHPFRANGRDGKPNYAVPLERMILAYDSGDWAGRGAGGGGCGCDLEAPAHIALGKSQFRLAALGRVDGARRGIWRAHRR